MCSEIKYTKRHNFLSYLIYFHNCIFSCVLQVYSKIYKVLTFKIDICFNYLLISTKLSCYCYLNFYYETCMYVTKT